MPILASRSLTAISGTPVGFFASTTGSSLGDGSITNPWDLPTAFAGGHTHTLVGGETCWIRAGTYNSSSNYDVTCTGVSGNPIIFRAYPGERAKVVGPSATGTQTGIIIGSNSGSDRRFQDLEVYCSDTNRTTDGERIAGIICGSRDDAINNVVHDCGQGITSFFDGPSIVRGNILYYNGTQDPAWNTRLHNLYLHNSTGLKIIRNNVILRASGFGLHGFATAADTNHMHIERCVSADNGQLAGAVEPNLFIGGSPNKAVDIIFDTCTAYTIDASGGTNVWLGYGNNYGDCIFRNNYIVGGDQPVDFELWDTLTIQSNFVWGGTFRVLLYAAPGGGTASYSWDNNDYHRASGLTTAYGIVGTGNVSFTTWKANTGFDGASTDTGSAPGSAKVQLWANDDDARKATLTIVNWPDSATVSVDLSSFLSPGVSYSIIDTSNYFGSPVASGTYAGGTVSVPMNNTPCAPIGLSAPPSLGPRFGCFEVRRQ